MAKKRETSAVKTALRDLIAESKDALSRSDEKWWAYDFALECIHAAEDSLQSGDEKSMQQHANALRSVLMKR